MAITGLGTNTNQYVATSGMTALGIPELATFHPFTDAPSYVIPYALVITTTDWNASATYPQAAYWFEARLQDPISRQLIKVDGQGYVANASVSTTPVPRLIGRAGVPGQPQIVTATSATMPAELAAFAPFSSGPGMVPSVAQLVYTANWNPALTTPQVAYYFRCWAQGPTTPFPVIEYSGVGWVSNASVSTTPVPRLWTSFSASGTAAGDGGNSAFATYSRRGVQMNQIGEDNVGNGAIGVYNSLGAQTIQLDSQAYLDSLQKVTGGQLAIWTSLGAGIVGDALASFPVVTVSASAQ